VPIALFAIAVIWASVHLDEPESPDHKVDYPGIAAISIGLVSLLIALDQVDDWGWGDPRVIAMLAIAAIGVFAFVPIERRAGSHGLVPPAIISNRGFAASCVAILCMSATFFASLLYLPQFMERQLGFSPLEAGLGIIPALGTFALVSFVAGPLYERVGAKRLATFGAGCMCAAAILFSLVDAGDSYGALVPGMIVLGIGIGSFYSTATTAGVTSVDESQASLAGGIVYMFQIAGGSIGLGLTTTIFSANVPPFVDGFQAGFRLDAGIALVGVAISLLFVGGPLWGRRRTAEATA
jgi:predicted MFS family arabinose efflux permease